MIAFNYNTDIGYLISFNGNILPIRPIQVDKDIQKNGVKYHKGETLYIHDQIIRYYILKGFIKNSEHLLQESAFHLFCGLSNSGITVMIRTMHQFQVFCNRLYYKTNVSIYFYNKNKLKEPLQNIVHSYFNGTDYEIETFPNLKSAVHVLNTRYREQKGGKKK